MNEQSPLCKNSKISVKRIAQKRSIATALYKSTYVVNMCCPFGFGKESGSIGMLAASAANGQLKDLSWVTYAYKHIYNTAPSLDQDIRR